ncbi:hypothetical protein ASG01_08355 [Chryseobacterium sp. Leaf180]|uniref:glycosyltransferase family protein n=1 Tax=Chryseobacterium sp. Leaf180 TaxID=1736289 RepID=UPI0006F3FD97|nr:hypothetical protein [Chryseobacterium sp. Leaf180]KQR93925.1 hypothetical protein ASG01_08355 [Chryseobacterium sp. Leaf180]
MKICVISFDFWHYDEYIVEKLKEKGVDAYHINIGAFTHKNFAERLKNTASKVLTGRNLKHEKRQNFILESLEKIGIQDQILVINPEAIEKRVHDKIRQFARRNIAYLYDSMARNPAEHILHYFDDVFSFDDDDVKKFGFQKITNYNYLPYQPSEKIPERDLFYITSYDKTRIARLQQLIHKTRKINAKFRVIVAGKKSWKNQLAQIFKKENADILTFRRKNISQKNLPDLYKNTKAILDLQRENQTGLSFRIFEAMALEKKFVTDNEKIESYDFYNPQNILILNKDFSNVEKSFFGTEYQKLPQDIYEKYTLDHWIKTVFKL